MKTINKFSAFALCSLFAAACTYDFPEITEEPTQGDADFTKMISVGNSLTAGFMNGALYTASQDNSFVAILAAQMKLVGGGETFNQPSVNSVNGCYNPADGCTAGRLYLKIGPNGPAPTPKAGDGGASLAPLTAPQKAALNNFGVPGATIGSALSPALSGNPFYGRIASEPGTSTLIEDAAAALGNGGTFFTFWLGNNDVLGYATSGGAAAIPTDPEVFEDAFNAALDAMLDANDAYGAVGNIPDVTSIPFFSTVAWNVVKLTSEGQADALNAAYAPYNAGVAGAPITAEEKAKRTISFRYKTVLPGDPGYATAPINSNALVIVDEYLTDLTGGGLPNYRQATATDLITLTAGAVIPTGGGTSSPLGDQYVLLPQEKTIAQDAVTDFNEIIAASVAANSDRLVLVNANAALSLIKNTSVTINGSSITASIQPPNGAFSLDGVHPNARGSAYIANEFIKAINGKFGSNIPLCNPNAFGGNELPVP